MARSRSLPEAPACNFLPFPQMFANFCRGWHHCRRPPPPPPPACNYLFKKKKKKNLKEWLSVGNLLWVERPFCTVLEIEATMQHQCPWSMFVTTHQKPTYASIIEPLFYPNFKVHNSVGRLAQQSGDDFRTATTSVDSKHTQIARQEEDRSTVLLKTLCE